jgi:hypothetical protein
VRARRMLDGGEAQVRLRRLRDEDLRPGQLLLQYELGFRLRRRGRLDLRPDLPVSASRAAPFGAMAFAWAYVAIDWLALPRAFFLPLEDRIVWAAQPKGPAIGYPGACLAAGLVALGVTALAARLLPPRAGRRLGVAAAVSVAGAMAYFLWRNWP